MKTAADIFSQLNGLRLSDGTSAGERLRTTVTPPSQPSSSSPAQSQGVFAFALPKGSQGNDLQQQIQQLQQQKQQQQQALVTTSSSSSSPVVLSTPPTTTASRPTAQLSLSQMLRGTTNVNTNGNTTTGQSGHLPPPPYPGNASKEERTNSNTTTAGRKLNGSSTTPVKVTGAAGAITRVSSSSGVSITIGGSAAAVQGTSSPVVVVPASNNSSSGFAQGGMSNVVPPSSSTASSPTQAPRVAAQVTSTLPMSSAATSGVPNTTSHLPPTAPLPNVRSAALRANETLYSPCLVPQLHTPSLRSSSGVNSPTSLNDVMGPPAATSGNTNHQQNSNNTTNNSNTAAQRSIPVTTTGTSGVTTWHTAAGSSAQANAQRGGKATSTTTTTTTSAPPVTAAITSTNHSATMSRATLRSPVVEQLKAVAPSAAFTTSPVKSSTLQPYSPISTAVPASNNNTSSSNIAGPTIIAGTGEALNPKVLEFFHNARSLTSSGTGSAGLNGANVVSGDTARSAKGQEGTRQSKTMVSGQDTSNVNSKATQGTKSATTADNTHSTNTTTSKTTLPVPRHEQAARQAAATHLSISSETVNEAELRAKIASAVSSGNVNRAAVHGTTSSKTATKTNADLTGATSGSNGHTPGRTSVAATSVVPESRRRESAEAKSSNNNAHEMTMQEATAVNAFLPAAFGDKELLDNTTVQKPLIRQLPSIPADGRYIIVGDVHGCVEQLEALVAKVKYVPGHDCLVVIGDFVNKGPDSVGVIRLCQRLKVLGVLGNHDYTLLKCCARHRRKAYCPDDLRDPVKRLAKDFPLDCELYLRGLPHMLRLPKYNLLLVHAGLNLEHSIEEQSMIEIMHLRRLEKVTGNKNSTSSNAGNDKLSKCEHSPRERAASTTNAAASPVSSDETHKEHYVAITKGQAGTPWAELWSGPEHVIFGHDAYAGFQAHRFAYGIDTGCVYGDPLTCVVFSATSPQGEFYSVPGLPRHANELMGLPPPNSDIYEQLQPDLERHIIRPTTRSTPMQLMPGSPALFASTPADFVGSFQLGPATSGVQNNSSSAFPAQVTLCGVNVSTADAMSNGSPNASLTKPLSSPILHSARTTNTNSSNAHHELALTNTSASLHMLQTALNEAASVATYEVQKATLLALATAHELRALGVVLAMPVYEKDVDAMMNADATNETAQQAFWSPFARGILEAAINSRHEGPDEVEDMVRLVLSVCEMMARVRREVTPMLKAMLDTSEATQGWSRSIQKHISIVLQD